MAQLWVAVELATKLAVYEVREDGDEDAWPYYGFADRYMRKPVRGPSGYGT